MAHIFLLSVAVILMCVPSASSQTRATTADLAGAVYDQSGAVLAGVAVTATHVESGFRRTVVSGANGRFVLPALPPGPYVVRAESNGFTPLVREGLTLALGATVDIDLMMTAAGPQEQITVTADPPVLDTQKTALTSTVSQLQIDSLPINGRNFISFSAITPGVTTDRTPQQGASATSGLTFAGQRARSNNITVDGVDNNDSAVGGVRATFSQEAVREFQVLASSYSAEFGKASGGVVNIITKSGTNRPAGNLFFYLRDEALNAKERFEKFDPAGHRIEREKAPYGQKQFGAILGGPIRHDKSFVFLSFERLDVDANNFVTIDDTSLVTLGALPLGTPKDILERAGFVIETGNVPYEVKTSSFLGKIDHYLSPAQNVTFRFNYGSVLNENIEPWGGQVARSRGAVLDSTDSMVFASHTFVAPGNLVNEARFQYARRDQDVNSLDPRCGGPCIAYDQGGPTIEVPGIASAGRHRFTPQPRRSRRWQALDTVSYNIRDHNLKAGMDFSLIQNRNEALPLTFGGRFIFASALPGALFGLPVPAISAIQAVALGLPVAYVQGYGVPAVTYSVSDLSLFLQDDWRVLRSLTVKLGLRYQTQFWPDTEYSAPGVNPYTFPSGDNNYAPRIGIAWTPVGENRTVIHGAYGLFYDNHITAINGITDILDGGPDGVRTLVTQLPSLGPIVAWNAPGRKLPEAAVGTFPTLKYLIDPGLKTPYAHQGSIGIDQELSPSLALSANFVYARGHAQLGTLDYNPLLPDLGPGRRPEDIGGVPGTSAPILQYTSFGETWYRGMTLVVNKRYDNRYQFLASYTLSKAEDTSTDFQGAFIPQINGRGRDRENPTGLPIGFDSKYEKGPSVQDQRHRFVFSGSVVNLGGMNYSTIVTLASGRPYTILAGADLNGDGNGGSLPPDRARRNPTDESSSLTRNSATLPWLATVDLRASRRFSLRGRLAAEPIVEVFNLFNRTNYTDINNVFGIGAYPTSPVPTFGQFTQAAPPRQMQLAVRLSF